MSERYTRQDALINQETLNRSSYIVIGCGAIGRNVALQLASIGVTNLTIVDFDIVEETNVVTQGFRNDQIGLPKVEALKADCLAINKDMQITVKNGRFTKNMTATVVFACVDNMRSREFIWQSVKNTTMLFIDCRMSAEIARILTIINPNDDHYYETTLFADENAYQGSCTAQSTIYCANIASALAVSSLTKWLRRVVSSVDTIFNIFADEFETKYDINKG